MDYSAYLEEQLDIIDRVTCNTRMWDTHDFQWKTPHSNITCFILVHQTMAFKNNDIKYP